MFLSVADAMQITGLSKSVCYKIIEKTNKRLKEKGYITVAGKCYRKAFYEALGIEV